MKVIRIVSILLCVTLVFGFVSHADEAKNWYIVKKGNCIPGFPDDAMSVSEYGGIYIDRECQEKGEKRLYLTFDAGYENGNIEKILDIMKDEGVTGAFFILSNLIKKNPEIIIRMVEDGHLVCNHTYNHKDMTKLSSEEMMANISKLENEYLSLTGQHMEKIFRFPEGRYSVRTLKLLNENGYRSVFWSMAYDDWDNNRQMDPNIAKNKLLSTTHNGAIILMHPTSATNVAILRDMINAWRAMGYSFGTLKDI